MPLPAVFQCLQCYAQLVSRSLQQAIFELMLSLPEVEEARSHGVPVFKVAGKTFAYWVVNHHDDGRVALWLACSAQEQQALIHSQAAIFFIPPYLGVKGWVGLDLTNNPPWPLVIEHVTRAWDELAPASLKASGRPETDVAPPGATLTASDINPMLSERAQEILAGLAKRCELLPATSAQDAHATATWRVGKKVFVRGNVVEGRLQLLFRVGGEQQAHMLGDSRFSLPAYFHASGWIAVDVQDDVNWEEVEALLETSYRHFALKSHLKLLDESLPE